MQKTLLFCSSILFASTSFAAPGDTTTVVFHDVEELSWHDNYDADNILPDGSVSYNKIILEFELGKYACDGYDPSNPGEGSNQTGWCGDWDYDVHVQAINANDKKVELGRLITPYANHNFPRTPLEWKQSYYFDVTDYYTFLKDDMTLRIFYAGYSGGFTGTTKLHFIEGPRHRDVLDYEVLYLDSYAYGDTNNPINDALDDKTLTAATDIDHGEVRVIITGHGGDNTQNCAEFCSKYYEMTIADSVHKFQIWRDDCGSNFLYPQSGTWVFDRANWCPGDQVEPVIHPFGALNANDNLAISMNFQDYVSGNQSASYKLSATAFMFSALHFEYDAGIEAIISPTTEDKYFRHNPSCGIAEIRVKNYGSEDIQSLKVQYTINGTSHEYLWEGNIASLASQDIIIPIDDATSNLDVNDMHNFSIEILEINGEEDENEVNNSASSEFLATPKWEGGDYEFKLKTSANIQEQVNKAYIKIYDLEDNIIYSLDNTVGNSVETDHAYLANGCYRMEVSTPLGLGLRFFNYLNMPGYIEVKNLTEDANVTLLKNNFIGSLKGNFGNGFTEYFEVVNSPYSVSVQEKMNKKSFKVYPNPARDYIQVEIDELQDGENVSYIIYNILGQELLNGKENKNTFQVDTRSLKSGNYFIELQNSNIKKSFKINIQK